MGIGRGRPLLEKEIHREGGVPLGRTYHASAGRPVRDD
jgi:hypothetical protein